jgi:hypothetical protein
MEDLVAKPEWSAIRPRLTIPQSITERTVEQIDTVTFDGISTKLLPNDLILFVFADGAKRIKRYVRSVQPNTDFSSTTVSLIPTTLSARQLVDDVHHGVRDFVFGLPATVPSMTFLGYLKAELERFGSSLTPEAGLVALDTACVDESSQWRDLNLAIDSSDVRLSAVVSAFDIDGFVADAQGTFGNTIDAFLTDQAKLPTVVTLLKQAWGDAIAGNGGISDDIPVSAMQAKVTTAIGAAGTGITGAISTWTGVLKITADKLVTDLGVLAGAVIAESPAARRQFRKDYVKSWATFTDQSQGAFESKRNTTPDTEYDPSKFETLVSSKLGELKAALAAANPDFVVIADGIKDARRTTTSIGWLARTGLSSAATPLELRIRFDFVGGAAPDTVGPVVAEGLFDRLAKDPGGGVDTVASIFKERDDTLTQNVDNAKGEHLEAFSVTPSFDALVRDLKDVGTKIQSIPTSAAVGAFATPVAQCHRDCLQLQRAIADAKQGLTNLKDQTQKLVNARRTEFVSKVEEYTASFGDPNAWGTATPDLPNAQSAKHDLVDGLLAHIRTVTTLNDKVNAPDPAHSLNLVIQDFTDSTRLNYSKYVPSNGTPYAARHRLLVAKLDQLLKQVSGFDLQGQERPEEDQFPGAAGLADALKVLTSPAGSSRIITERTLAEAVSNNPDQEQSEIPDLFRQVAGSLSQQL